MNVSSGWMFGLSRHHFSRVCQHSNPASVTSHRSYDVRLNTVIGISAGDSEATVTSERQRLHGEGGEGHDCRSRGTEASKEHGNSGAASSATVSSGIPVRRHISTPPSPQPSPITRRWRFFVVRIFQKDRMRVRRESAQMMEEDL